MKNFKLFTVLVLLLIIAVTAYKFFVKPSSTVIPNDQSTNKTAAVNKPPADCSGTPTVALTEGPYYKASSPERSDIRDSAPGEKLTVTGYVFDTSCKPIANAWIDFWQADGAGVYDNDGYNLRGHQFTDEEGKYTLTTVAPGQYPGRTPHIHVKLKAPDGQEVTSQMFFPGITQNETDSIYDESLLMKVNGDQATFNFVLET